MIVVYRHLFGERLYDRMYDTKTALGRPSPSLGARIEGRLERGKEVVITANHPASWRVLMRDDGTFSEDLPDFSDEEESRHEQVWALYEGIQRDFEAVKRGAWVSAERVLLLLKTFEGIDPARAAMKSTWKSSEVFEQGSIENWAAVKSQFERAYLGESKPTELAEVCSQLHHATKAVEKLLERADSIVLNHMERLEKQAPVEQPKPVDFAAAMERFKKKPTV